MKMSSSLFFSKAFIWSICTILFLSILPFFIISFFNHPYGDDLTYNYISRNIGYLEAQSYWYKYGNGRYLSTLILSISSLAQYPFYIYKLIPIILLILSYWSIYYSIRTIFLNISKTGSIINSLFILIIFIYQMPSVKEGFFWLASSITYQLPMLLSMFFFSFLIKFRREKKIRYGVLSGICFISIFGGSETNFIAVYLILVFWSAQEFLIDQKSNYFIIALICIGAVLILLSYYSPGNQVRNVNALKNYNLLDSIILSSKTIANQILNWLPFIILSIILMFQINNKLNVQLKLISQKFCNPWIIVLTTIIIIITCLIPSFLILGNILDRVLNIVYFYFLIGFLLFIYSLAQWSNLNSQTKFISAPLSICVISILFLFKYYYLNNVKTAYAELIQEKALKYNVMLEQRYELIKLCPTDTCVVPKLKYRPRTLFYNDIAEFPNDWRNFHYADQFGKKIIMVK